MAYPYGSKIEIDNFDFQTGGGAVNAATNFSNLGLNASTIVKIGDEIQAENVLKTLTGYGVDISNVVKFLISEDSSFITGQTVTVDGGMI